MDSQPITLMLQELAAGDKTALDRLMPHVYSELRNLAGRNLRDERSGHTSQPTALVHETYVRLVGSGQPDYTSRAHLPGSCGAADAPDPDRSRPHPQCREARPAGN